MAPRRAGRRVPAAALGLHRLSEVLPVQQIVLDKPYVFSPPHPGVRWPRFLQKFARRRLWREFGITDVEVSGLEHLDQSRRAGHGILLAPNHCRPADPFVISEMARRAAIVPHVMASAH